MTLDPAAIRYLADNAGNPEAAVVPIDLWREIASELETRYLLDSPAMRDRLLRAINTSSDHDVPIAKALTDLGVRPDELPSEDDE